MRVPGPDGELGTADDLTFLVAQATAEAEFLVEGLREGTHIVDFDLDGVLEGLPTGIRRIQGTARGAVVVRDPTLGIVVSHPDVVRADEEYTMEMSVTNNGVTPANLVSIALPPSGLAGVQVVGENRQTIESILPGESELVEFRLRPLLTGRVIASFVRADNHITPSFDFHVGVGEAGIPLSPTEIVLPQEVEALPPTLRRQGLGLIGLGFSLATAPAALRAGRPEVSREEVDQRVFELAQAGRYIALGEAPFDSLAELAVEWTGAPDQQWEWDALRRITRRGALVGDAMGQVFRGEAATTGVTAAFERFAATTAGTARVGLVATDGTASYLEVTSRTSGKALFGPGTAADRLRELPFADLYDLGSGELALLAAPETGGYRVTLRRRTSGVADLSILAPPTAGELAVWSWPSVGLSEHGRAVVDFAFAAEVPTLAIDPDGDGDFDDFVPGTLRQIPVRPFAAVAAVQNSRVDKTGHVIDVLFTGVVDFSSLLPRHPAHFEIAGKVSDGGTSTRGEGALEAFRPSRLVKVVFNNPLSPYVTHEIEVQQVASALGELVSSQVLPVVITATMPGTIVEGRVISSAGEPIPFARVELAETDYSNIVSLVDPCIKHVTAAVLTDGDGRFRFDYVRQTECGGVFEMRGFEPGTHHVGQALGRVRYIGQVVELDIVLLGRGLVRGRVTYDDGTVPTELRVVAASPVFLEARRARLDGNGNYDVGDLPVGVISLSAQDGSGNFALATVEIESAGAVVEHDLFILRQPPAPSGELRGHVFDPDGTTPVYNAYLALYVGGGLVDVRRSDLGGGFDFGSVPAGPAEIEAFDAETGRSGAGVFFSIAPDQVTDLTIRLRDERGAVSGHVYRRQLTGDATPVVGAVVYVNGQPFHTVTDASGFFRLDGVVAGVASLVAADLESQRDVREQLLLTGDDFDVVKDLYFPIDAAEGGIAGEFLSREGVPVAGALVHIAVGDVNWIHEAVTDAAGRFSIVGLVPGTYSVHAFRGAEGGSATTTIAYPGHIPFVSIRVKKGTVTGTVRAAQEAGEPVGVRSLVRYRTTVVRFGLVGLDTQSHDVETDANGHWELPNLLVGPYAIEIFNAFYGMRPLSGYLTSDGEVVQRDVLFELAATVEGTVYDYDGVTPVAGASVSLAHHAFSNYTVATDEQGRFRFEGIPPDPYYGFAIRAHYETGMVYRDAEIRATAARHGETLAVTLTLPVQGAIAGRVETGAGVPVGGATIRLRGGQYPYQSLAAQTDTAGEFAFQNVLAGNISISALSLNGLGGRTTATIASEGEEKAVLIRLQPVGAITGRILSPIDGSPVASAQVRLIQFSSFFDAVTTDAQGRYLFDALPINYYTVKALDLGSGRSGQVAGIHLYYEEQVITSDLVLEARGTVRGHLLDPGGSVPVPGATIALMSLGLVPFQTFASTDGDGRFEFQGIPQGNFTLRCTELGGYRQASGSGVIVHEDEEVTVDLVLQESGTVTGFILEPVAGSTVPFSGPTSVGVYDGSRLVGGSVTNPYYVSGMLADRTFKVYAYENGGAHRGYAEGILHDEGEESHVDVRLWPIGSVRVVVLDAADQPVGGAALTLTSWGPYGTKRFNANTTADGSATFLQVGSGSLSVSATDPLTELRGSATGTLTFEGAEALLEVRLEPSAELRGTVLLADGVNPAVAAQVVMRIAGRTYYSIADDDGLFVFDSLPLGSFTYDLLEHLGPGEWHGSGLLPLAGAVVDLGIIVLDAADPTVEALAPGNGAVGVALGSSVRIDFSEPISTSYQSNWVELRRLAGSLISVNTAWSADRRTLTLTPTAPLASFTSYQVKVTTWVMDFAQRHVQSLVQGTFTTLDAVPPQVSSTLPVQGAKNVLVDVQFRVEFTEAVTLESLSGSALQLVDVDDQVGVATTFTLQPQGREVLITPVANLAPDHVHRLTIQGVRDPVGNVMAQPYVLELETADITPPVVSGISPAADSSVTSGQTIEIAAVVTDNQAPGTVTLRLLGRSAVLAPPASGSTYRWTFTVPPVAAQVTTAIEVEARDAAGNVTLATSALTVEPLLDPDSPFVAVVCPSSGAILAPGTSLWVTVEATDNQGLLAVELFLDASPVPVATFGAPPFRYRLTAPSTAHEGEVLRLRAVATDYGLKSTEAEIEIGVVEGEVLSGSRTIAADDPELDGRSVIVAAGTVTIDGPHTFRDLVVLDAASVNHREATPGAQYILEVELTRDLFVACEGTVNVSGQGYVGGARYGGRAYGYGNSQAEGANYLTGASHAGRGGLFDGSSLPYGSLFEPREPGGGAGGSSASAGSDGGGGMRIAAGRRAVVDGALRANGAANLAAGAAGGSIRLAAAEILGAGVVEANGGPGGGGGRVALYANTLAGGLVSRTRAWGGQRTGAGINASYQGAAGTVFLKRAADDHGELVIDNRGLVSTQWTELRSVGEGIVDEVAADSITDLEADFRSSLVGIEVYFNGDTGTTWPVVAHAHHGSTLTLDVASLPLAAAVGDSYAGRYLLDRVTVRGAAKARVVDAVVLAEPATVEPGATWSADYVPPLLSLPDVELVEGSDGETLVHLTATLSRPAEENAAFTYTAVGETATVGEDFVAATGTLTIPFGGSTATVPLRVLADTIAESDETLRVEISAPTGLAPAEPPMRLTLRDDDGGTHCAGPELLVNGDAEEPLIGGLIPGWTNEGTPNWLAPAGSAHSGSHYFEPRASACPRGLRQDVDVTSFAPAIDAGGLSFALSGYVRSLDGSPPDTTQIEVEYRDGANSATLGRVQTATHASLGVWARLSALFQPPPGTRFLRVRLIVNGTYCGSRPMGGYFDSLSLAPFDFPSLGVSDVVGVEGTGGLSTLAFRVDLACALGEAVTVHAATAAGSATAPADFAAIEEDLTFAVGETQKLVTIDLESDAIDESDETLTLVLSSPSGAFLRRTAAVGTILDDDTATLAVGDVTVTEGTGGTTTAAVSVTLSTPSAQTVSLVAATAAGTATAPADFTTMSSTLTFAAGETVKTVAITIAPDAVDEDDETFYLRLASASGATIADDEAVITIADDDDNHLTIADVQLAEGTDTPVQMTFTVQLSSPVIEAAEVQFHTEDITAAAGTDYQTSSGTLSIPPGASSATVVVDLLPDADVEPPESFRLVVTQATGVTLDDPEAIGTLLDDDLTVTIADLALPEGNSGLLPWIFPVTLNAPAPIALSLAYTTAELPSGAPGRATAPGDFMATSGALNFAPGETQSVIVVNVRGDTVDEPLERFLVRLSLPVNVRIADGEGDGSILDDEPPTMTGFSSPTPPGRLFDSGVPLDIQASAFDAAGIANVTFELDGVSFVDTQSPYAWATTTPVPAQLTTYTIRATALDGLGNSKTIQTTIRVRAPQIPPSLHPELVAIGYDFFGLSAIGLPGAVTDPTDPPLGVVARNLRTAEARSSYALADGSFSVLLEGLDGDSFELVAYDSIGLASQPMTLGPLLGDEARVANLGFGSTLAAAERNELAVCDCAYEPPGPETGEWGVLDLRLFDASSPLAPVLQGALQISLNWTWEDSCATGGNACSSSCSEATGYQPCYNDCINACPSGDTACYDACSPSCGGAQYGACNAHCDAGAALCGPPGACESAATACTDSCSAAGSGANCVAACAAFSDVCAAAPPPPSCLTGPSACTDFCYSLVDVEPCYSDYAATCAPEDGSCFDSCYLTCGGARMDSCADPCDAGWDANAGDLCSSGVFCADAAAACASACQSAGGDPDCTNACALFTNACVSGGPPPPAFYRYPFTGFDFADDAAAMTQGPVLRIVDLRDPANPVLDDTNQSLTLLPGTLPAGVALAGVRLEGGYAYTVENLAPNRLFVVDVHDASHPRLLATTSLNLGAIDGFEVEGGKLHVTVRSGSTLIYRLFALGEPGEVLAITHSGNATVTGSTSLAMTVVDDLATFLRSSSTSVATLYSFHGQGASEAPLTSKPLTDRYCDRGSTTEVGDLFAISCDAAEVAAGVLDTSLTSQGYTLDRWWPTPTESWETVSKLLVAAGRLWTFPGAQGYASSALWPWLEESLLTVEVTATGATLAGAPGSAAEATVVRAELESGGTFEVPVALDGSFVLALSGELRGEKVTLQAVFEVDATGNKVRLRIPLGNPESALDLSASGGARRVARDGDLLAVVPAELDGSGFAHLPIVSTAAGLTALAEVIVEGPVIDSVLVNGVLYVGGARLAVFDLADPANPLAQTEVDLFAGSPVVALVQQGGRLWALGAESGSHLLLAVDLSSPLAPVAVPAESLLVADVPESRLFARDGDLYRLGTARIERYDLAPGVPPVLAASGSPAGATLVDLESADSGLFVAARGQGVRGLFEATGVLTLGAAPSPAQPATGLFAIPEAGGERLWRAAGLGGAAENASTKRAPTSCLLRDVVVSATDVLLLTGCGIEREVLP
ncbi:MAG: carboxypeptidase regulatory-like domain-containing protein [Thermoanaerobaculia bacterium]